MCDMLYACVCVVYLYVLLCIQYTRDTARRYEKTHIYIFYHISYIFTRSRCLSNNTKRNSIFDTSCVFFKAIIIECKFPIKFDYDLLATKIFATIQLKDKCCFFIVDTRRYFFILMSPAVFVFVFNYEL